MSAWRQAAGGPLAGVAETFVGSEGRLFFHSGTNADATVVNIGNLPAGPRRIRCSLPICATTHFTDSQIGIVTWDGVAAPSIIGTANVGSGPVGVDVAPSSGGVAILTTGFNDNTYTVTEVDEAGAVLGQTTKDVPDGCVNPGHAVWLRDGGGNAVITCFSSDNFALIPGVLP